MKLKINTDQLRKAVAALMRTISNKSPFPILDCLLLEPNGDILTLTASDLELTTSTKVPLLENTDGHPVALPAKVLNDLLKNLPSGDITFIKKEEYSAVINWDNGTSILPVFLASDYPLPGPVPADAVDIDVTQKTLKEALEKTSFAACQDTDVRPALTGVLLDCTEDLLSVAATDTHKMMTFMEGQIKPQRPTKAIIPKKAASMLKSMLEKEGQVKIQIDENSARFSFGTTELVTRLIKARYPNYRNVIPQNNENLLSICRSEILNIIKRISVCSDKASMMLRMDLGKDTVKISAQDLGYSVSANETVTCSYDGKNMSIGFKAPMIIEVLSAIESEMVNLFFGEPNRALLITPADESEAVKGVVMPIAL